MVDEPQLPISSSSLALSEQNGDREVAIEAGSSVQVYSSGSPLAAIFNTAGKEAVLPGSTFSFTVTISNKGDRSAIIDVAIDDRANRLRDWCSSRQERIALGADQSGEVVFPIRVPIDAMPGVYPFLVIIDAQDDYPEDTPIQFAQQIQVLPTAQDAAQSNDPTFALQPVTTPATPTIIQPGAALPVQVLVNNRSDRVDRFRLVCTDLPRSWFSVIYPQGFQGSGLVVQADCLNLNPGEQNLISLIINPPLDALAGNYVPTLRLYSENNPDLVLLDLVYIQIQPIYLLQVELRILIGRVRQQAGIYQVRLTNTGNTQREVWLRCQNLEEDDLCRYTLEQSQVSIAPRELVTVGLQVEPKVWWRRPVLGGGRVLNFGVELEDLHQMPLTIDHLPGYLLWEARPWWQLLPFLVLGILGILAIAYLIWWVLFRVPPSPQIVQFFSEDTAYAAQNEDVVRLGWQITEPRRVRSLQLTGLSPEGKPLTRPEVYDLSQGIPTSLQPSCTQTAAMLECRNVRTNARQPGTYQFEMRLMPQPGRGAATVISQTKPVPISPLPQPTIVAFSSTQPVYQEPIAPAPVRATPQTVDSTQGEIQLNWTIANPAYLRSLQLIGRTTDGIVVKPLQPFDLTQGIPASLEKNCTLQEKLICQRVRTNVREPGAYMFELVAIPQTNSNSKPIPKKTEVIKIQSKPARILEFTLNGKPASAKYVIPIKRGQSLPNLLLFWRVDGSSGTKTELLPAPGTVPLKAAIPLILSPQPGSVTVTLQVTDPTGKQISRAVTLETVDPTDPSVAAAAAVGKAIAETQAATANAQKAGQPGASTPGASAPGQPGTAPGQPNPPPPLNAPAPATPGTLSPVELPPQFDRR